MRACCGVRTFVAVAGACAAETVAMIARPRADKMFFMECFSNARQVARAWIEARPPCARNIPNTEGYRLITVQARTENLPQEWRSAPHSSPSVSSQAWRTSIPSHLYPTSYIAERA